MKRLARATLLTLAVLTLLLKPNPTAVAAGDPPQYAPKYLPSPTFTIRTSQKLGEFVEQNGDSAFNIVGRFGLSFSDVVTYKFPYNYMLGFSEAERRIAAKDELGVAYSAWLGTDPHRSYHYHWDERNSWNTTALRSSSSPQKPGKLLHEYSGENQSKIYDDGTFVTTGSLEHETTGLTLYHLFYGCPCKYGRPTTERIAVMLADTGAPRIARVYTTSDQAGLSEKDHFRAGEAVYIQVRFDEFIRFSSDNPDDAADMRLAVNLKRSVDKQDAGVEVLADLVSLKDDTLTFVYTVPQTVTIGQSDYPTNYYIDRIDLAKQTSWIGAEGTYDLVYVYHDSTHSVTPKTDDALKKTSSLVVDLAGNPVASTGSYSLVPPCYIDAVAPTVSQVLLSVVTKEPKSDLEHGGSTFATKGDVIRLTVQFSEEMRFLKDGTVSDIGPGDLGSIKAELSLGSPSQGDPLLSGNPLVIAACGFRPSASTGISSPNATEVDFQFQVPEDAVPVNYGDEATPEVYAIGVNRVYVDDAAGLGVLSDPSGNDYDLGTLLVDPNGGQQKMPDRKLHLDRLPPQVTTKNAQTGGKYVVTPAEGPGRENEFYFSLAVSDTPSPFGSIFESGTEGVKGGSVTWKHGGEGFLGEGGFCFEYAFVANPDVQAEKYMSGAEGKPISLYQVGGDGYYLHVRLLDNERYCIADTMLVTEAVDAAGNAILDEFPLDWIFDNKGPTAVRTAQSTNFSSASAEGEIIATVQVTDLMGDVDDIEYQWVEAAAGEPDPVPGAWEQITVFDSIVGPVSTFTVTKANLEQGSPHSYYLFVRSLDQSGGQLSIHSFAFEYDLTLPKYQLTFITSPDGLHEKHSVIFKPESTEESPATTIAMIKIPGTESEYFVRSDMLAGEVGGPLTDDIFAIPANITEGTFAGWHRCTVTTGETGTVIQSSDNLGEDTVPDRDWGTHGPLSDLANRYYGLLDLTLIAANPNELVIDAGNRTLTIPGTANCAVLAYRLKSAYLNFGSLPHSFAVVPLFEDGTAESDDNRVMGNHQYGCGYENYTTADLLNGRPQAVRSLEGVRVKIDIGSLLASDLDPGYDLADLYEVEFEVGKYRYDGDGSMVGTDSVYSVTLAPVASRTVEIPAGIGAESGQYEIRCRLTSRIVSGILRDQQLMAYVDNGVIRDAGVTKVHSQMNLGGVAVPLTTEYPLSAKRPDEIYLSPSALEEKMVSLTFQTKYTPTYFGMDNIGKADGTHVYLRLRNEAKGLETGWVEMATGLGGYLSDGFSLQPVAEVTLSPDAVAALQPGDGDILSYQFMTSSGINEISRNGSGDVTAYFKPYMTPEQTFVVHMSGDGPTLVMQFSPASPTSQNVVATVKELRSGVTAPNSICLRYKVPDGDPLAFVAGDEIVITVNGTYVFAAYDKFGNYSVIEENVDWIDKAAPVLNATSAFDAGGYEGFAVTAEVQDASPVAVSIRFDDGDPSTNDPMFEVPTLLGEVWRANAPSPSGVHETTTSIVGDITTLVFKGVLPFDPGQPAGAIISQAATVVATDAAGNVSEQAVTLSAKNVEAECVATILGDIGLDLAFNSPVTLNLPAQVQKDPWFSLGKAGVTIYENGKHTLEYVDIFGVRRTAEIDVTAYDAFHDVGIDISTTKPTNADVVISLDASTNHSVKLVLPVVPPGDDSMTVQPIVAGEYVTGAVITVRENRTVAFQVAPREPGPATVTRKIVVGNIDRVAPQARVEWLFSAPVNDQGQTKGEVIAYLVGDNPAGNLEPVVGRNGKTLEHTFTLSDQTDYTFEYEDLAGNAGQPVAASLPSLGVTIVEKTVQETDVDKPAYSLSVYQMLADGKYAKVAGYTDEDYSNAFDNDYFITRAMRFDFDVIDVNDTKILLVNGVSGVDAQVAALTYAGPGEEVNGVSVAGPSLYITGNVAFTAVIIDANGNRTAAPITITKIDNEAPTGTVETVSIDFFKIRVYVTLADNTGETVTMRSKDGVHWDATKGAYYRDFTANGSFIFEFEDKAGNVGRAEVTVTEIDLAPPAVTRTVWSPCLTDSAGNPVPDSPPVTTGPEGRPLRVDVTARVEFNKAVTDVTAVLVDEDGDELTVAEPGDWYTLTYGAKDATVAFRQPARVNLAFKGRNLQAGQVTLVGTTFTIDSSPPEVSVVSDEGVTRVKSVKITLLSKEPASELQSGARLVELPAPVSGYLYGHGLTVTENGTYTFRFSDLAGNLSDQVSITLTQIDSEPPKIAWVDPPATRAEVEKWNAEHPEEPRPVSQDADFTLRVSMDEAGTIVLGQATTENPAKAVSAGEVVQFTVGRNGRYSVTATDQAGNVACSSILVDRIDKIAPTITFARSRLRLKEGTAWATFEAMANDGVVVLDNFDDNVTYSITNLASVDLDAPVESGSSRLYGIIYTAQDRAGHVTEATRTVEVYSKKTPTILIEGVKSEPGETLFFNGTNLELTVSLPETSGGETEPYKLYYSPGYKTPGQMKDVGQRLSVVDDKATLPVTDSGFYTIYLITQSRSTYITYVCVHN